MDRVEFRERFDRVKKVYAGEPPGEYLLLSVSGILREGKLYWYPREITLSGRIIF